MTWCKLEQRLTVRDVAVALGYARTRKSATRAERKRALSFLTRLEESSGCRVVFGGLGNGGYWTTPKALREACPALVSTVEGADVEKLRFIVEELIESVAEVRERVVFGRCGHFSEGFGTPRNGSERSDP